MKIAVFFADGFEDIEALSPVDYLRRANLDVVTVGVKGSSFNDKMIVTSSHKVPVVTDTTIDAYLKEMGDTLPDCVVCPGGMPGATNLAANEGLLNHLEKCFAAGKIVSALCASPAVVLGKTCIPAGKKWTCYPGMETESKAEYLKGYSNEIFITDGNLVTGRGPGASEQFSMELVKLLSGKETAETIRKASQQR